MKNNHESHAIDEVDSLFNESTRAVLDHEHPIKGHTPANRSSHFKYTRGRLKSDSVSVVQAGVRIL